MQCMCRESDTGVTLKMKSLHNLGFKWKQLHMRRAFLDDIPKIHKLIFIYFIFSQPATPTDLQQPLSKTLSTLNQNQTKQKIEKPKLFLSITLFLSKTRNL